MTNTLLPTTVVGSYPQPDWLVDRGVLAQNLVPRVRMKQMWRVAEDALEGAQDDATLVAIRDMERAGIDIVTDGEIRRESYSNRFALALDGVDVDNPARTMGRANKETLVPRVIGRIRRNRPVEVRDVEFLVVNTDRRTKITLPGPFTLSQQASDEYYKDEEAMAMDYAAAVNEEARDLKRAGVDIIQFDEPWMQARPGAAARFGVKALNRALEGLEGTTIVHLCFGYAAVVKDKPSGYSFLPQLADCNAAQISIEAAQPKLDLGVLDELPGKTVMLGVIDLGTDQVETPEIVADRIRAGLKHLPAERLVVAPDCGMKYLPRPRAFAKLRAMAEGAAIVRRELQG
ncbi:5-methyltetrahydropteroyltriglutamate--homocysteine methyltransferase [Roseomonas sp. WA12]